MSQYLISHSPDLKQLRDEGYEIEIKGGYLLVHHVPYLNKDKEIKLGILVVKLTLINPTLIGKQADHTVYFTGESPCDINGQPLNSIINSSNTQELTKEIIVNHYFSSKPPSVSYLDYYEKVRTYCEILCSQAKAINPNVTAKTFKVIESSDEDIVFNYYDTNSSRAEIEGLNLKYKGQRIGIIGLGGTGSYLLDLIAKTPVSEILIFDGDTFIQHNAFRSPGAPSIEDLNTQFKKVNYLSSIYSKMHKGIKAVPEYVTEENIEMLKDLSYVFLCIDDNLAKRRIISKLIEYKITFFEVGMGANIIDDCLIGTVRVTTGSSEKIDHISNRINLEDVGNNDYSKNIQIADLNALNAILAVIKWKKLCGFYKDQNEEYNSYYVLSTGQLINEDFKT